MPEPASLVERLSHMSVGELKPAEYISLARELRRSGEALDLRPLRVAVLSSFTFDFVDAAITVEGARAGYRVEMYYGPFNQFEQSLADDAALYAFNPDVLVLALRLEDVDADAVVRYHASGGARLRGTAAEVAQRLVSCGKLFRRHAAGPVLVANFTPPPILPLTVFDANAKDSLTFCYSEVNRQLTAMLAEVPGALVWDYAGLVRDRGAAEWSDRRLWALSRNPVAPRHQPHLAVHLLRTIHGAVCAPAKCLVLDLDHTLWGGVIGDDGMEGIELGDDFPGSAYKAFQRSVLALRDRGILIAVASKNDASTVEQVFREHPEMLLHWDDLAAVRINWEPKSANLRAIAQELNIGSDALVFFDDNPVERAEVRANAPEVCVVEVPSDPTDYEVALANTWWFDTPALSAEDRARAMLYQEERERRDLQASTGSVEEFLVGLEMEAQVGKVGPATMRRTGQLVQKTNQFNLTTRRYSDAEIAALAADPKRIVAWLRLRDRFGDAGLIAVGILRLEHDWAIVDTLVMSCRVMGRNVERAVLSYLAELARGAGCNAIVGDYLPTAKNKIVADLYPNLGFVKHASVDGRGTRYLLDLTQRDIEWPSMIRRTGDTFAGVVGGVSP